MKQAAVGYGCVALSLALHAAALRRSGAESARPQRTFVPVVMALTPPKLAQPLPPAPSPAPEPSPQPRPRPLPKAAPVPTEPEPAHEPPVAAEPPLTGTTLVAPGEASWAAAAGNGDARSGAIGAGTTRAAVASKAPPVTAGPALPATQPLARLSRKPVPPPLQHALERYYPALARSQGRSGEAKVRALIEPSGRVSHVQLSFESEPGFGAACQKALQQSQWTGPLGPSGEPTATFITYRCKFRIGD